MIENNRFYDILCHFMAFFIVLLNYLLILQHFYALKSFSVAIKLYSLIYS